jgi:hypothetical protein
LPSDAQIASRVLGELNERPVSGGAASPIWLAAIDRLGAIGWTQSARHDERVHGLWGGGWADGGGPSQFVRPPRQFVGVGSPSVRSFCTDVVAVDVAQLL